MACHKSFPLSVVLGCGAVALSGGYSTWEATAFSSAETGLLDMVARLRKSSMHPWVKLATPLRPQFGPCAESRIRGPKNRTPWRLYLLAMHASAPTELNAGAGRRLRVGVGATVAAALIGLGVGVGIGRVTRQSSHAARPALAPARAAERQSVGNLPALNAIAALPALRRRVSASPKRSATTQSAAVSISKSRIVASPSDSGAAPAVSSPSPAATVSPPPAPSPPSKGGGLNKTSGGE
jgi:hypothetical protein